MEKRNNLQKLITLNPNPDQTQDIETRLSIQENFKDLNFPHEPQENIIHKK
jgi:hypothetical protein